MEYQWELRGLGGFQRASGQSFHLVGRRGDLGFLCRLEAWYPGEFGGQAVAETLFGENNPAGRLTITFPRSTGQLPDFYNSDPSRVRKYVGDDGKPLFPFGFGLSYSTFRYDHLAVQTPAARSKATVTVTVDVTNTSDREGDEVAQLYLRQDVSSVETPGRSLKGFSRIHLKPNETRTVTFSIPLKELAIWNREKKWVVEPGSYTAWVGGSSEAHSARNGACIRRSLMSQRTCKRRKR